jgi:membrane-bound serine protease (ClpP class)
LTAVSIALALLATVRPIPLAAQGHAPPATHAVLKLVVDGAIHPASAELIKDAIDRAEEENAEALLIELDTPGGLLESTRGIVKTMLASSVPIIVYVAPEGARAGSAGVFITLAAHVAAMAPGTNIGAAHPVGPGGQDISPASRREPAETAPGDSGKIEEDGDLERKVVNDAVAFIRSIAAERGRNADWAERSVRESVSLPAADAVREGVVDLTAANEAELLRALDGRTVKVAGGTRTLRTAGAPVVEIEKGLRFKVLDVIANPNVAFILMMLGMYGLFFELASPGAILPGVVGAISILLALFAFQALPVNYVGLMLMLLAIILFLAEVKVVSHGILTIGGTIAFLLGATMLFESPEPAMRVSWAVILPALLLTVGFFVFAMAAALRARRAPPTTGREGIVGQTGVVRARFEPQAGGYRGKVFVRSELWNAVADEALEVGQRALVLANEGLTLRVRKAQ